MAYRSGQSKNNSRLGRNRYAYSTGSTGGSSSYHTSEPGEVVDIIRDELHPLFKTYEDIGKVQVKLLNSARRQKAANYPWAKPAASRNRDYPILHEIVMCEHIMGQLYYTTSVNVYNNPNMNALPTTTDADRRDDKQSGNKSTDYKQAEAGAPHSAKDAPLTLGKTFKTTGTVRPVQHNEGDVTYEGRLGQFIRFSSNDTNNTATILISSGPGIPEANSPIAQGRITDVNLGGSSIYITDNEIKDVLVSTSELSIHRRTETGSSTPSEEEPLSELSGRHIVITSGRLIINSNDGDIDFHSKLNTRFTSGGMFRIDSISNIVLYGEAQTFLTSGASTVVTAPNIYLGSDAATEHMVLGDVLVSLMKDILSMLKTTYKVKTAQGPSIGVTPDTTAAIRRLEGRVADILSAQNFTL